MTKKNYNTIQDYYKYLDKNGFTCPEIDKEPVIFVYGSVVKEIVKRARKLALKGINIFYKVGMPVDIKVVLNKNLTCIIIDFRVVKKNKRVSQGI